MRIVLGHSIAPSRRLLQSAGGLFRFRHTHMLDEEGYLHPVHAAIMMTIISTCGIISSFLTALPHRPRPCQPPLQSAGELLQYGREYMPNGEESIHTETEYTTPYYEQIQK